MVHVLVIGTGGREFAITQKLLEDSNIEQVVCAPGSDGMKQLDPIRVELCSETGLSKLRQFAKKEQFDLTVVGPEKPLVEGIVDLFRNWDLPIFGPTEAAARIEGSKVDCRNLLKEHGIPSPNYGIFTAPHAAKDYLGNRWASTVIKADGLAAGKGVFVPSSQAEAFAAIDALLVNGEFGEAGELVVIEERLYGRECSVLALCDGTTVIPFIPAQDYKRVGDGNRGPNTGGMGCYAPVGWCTEGEHQEILEKILQPTVDAMRNEGRPYSGVLYAGLMLMHDGPKVLEFNCRFGDPETQVLLPMMIPELYPLLKAASEGTLTSLPREKLPGWHSEKTVCLVLCSPGYPGSYQKGLAITGMEKAQECDVTIVHAGTKRSADGSGWETNGGRVLNLVARAPSFEEARKKTLAAAACITFGGEKPLYRTDIAGDAM